MIINLYFLKFRTDALLNLEELLLLIKTIKEFSLTEINLKITNIR